MLAQVRQEAQRTSTALGESSASARGEPSSDLGTTSTAVRNQGARVPQPATGNATSVIPPENNTAFLAYLPQSLRREVLADMEDSQIDLLSTDLQNEARGLRREQDEHLTRNVRGRFVPAFFRPRHDREFCLYPFISHQSLFNLKFRYSTGLPNPVSIYIV